MKRVIPMCAVALVAVALSGCGANPPEEPSDAAPTTLVLAHLDNDLTGDPAAQWFIDRVAEESDGALTIEFANECCGRAADNQSTLVENVASGEFDLGWLAVRGLEDLGVEEFQALEAPLLIDHYAAEEAVLASDIPDRLLGSLDALDVTGIALEPGMLRRPIVGGEFPRTPTEFAGRVMWTVPSTLSAASFSALGATPSQVANDDRNSGLESGEIDGVENSVFWQVSTQHVVDPVITRNTAFWPRISALVANPDSLGGLSDEQAGWLQAAADAVAESTMDVAAVDAEAVAEYCATGGRFVVLDETSRAQWEEALEPVYAGLESDPDSGSLLAEIRSLIPDRESVENELDPPADCQVP